MGLFLKHHFYLLLLLKATAGGKQPAQVEYRGEEKLAHLFVAGCLFLEEGSIKVLSNKTQECTPMAARCFIPHLLKANQVINQATSKLVPIAFQEIESSDMHSCHKQCDSAPTFVLSRPLLIVVCRYRKRKPQK